MIKYAAALAGLTALASPALAQDAPGALRPDQAEFRALYKELVETNTTLSSGSCTLAAERMAVRLKAAGFKDDQLQILFTSDHPKDGSLVAIYPGTSKKLKPMQPLPPGRPATPRPKPPHLPKRHALIARLASFPLPKHR